MSSGARQITQIAKEAVVGVTPAPFDRTIFEFTENGIDATVTKEESKSITSGRLARSSMITGVEYAGDLNIEAKYSPLVQELMAAAAFNEWANDVLVFGGTKRQTFSILRGFDDVNDYHVFRGCHVNTFNIDIPEKGIVKMSFGLMALGRKNFDKPPAGAIADADDNPKLSNVSIGEILIDGVSQKGVSCITAFSYKWDNTMQLQNCLGNKLDAQAILEMIALGTGNFTSAWSRKTSDMYEKQFTNKTISLKVPIEDTEGNKYEIFIPKAEIKAPLPAGGKGDIINTSFEYTIVDQAPTITRIAAPKTKP
ncbi:hypothetical protein F889_01541 [Acinetobacter colistiniresistens]|uniref:Phage tail protein n=1 Tax=Acinetobacter colistiniresistens TaxID=280145 RepID=N9QXU6_9GAMM|nr:phage tail tube protein [Acinetobacter colistiniresistens]ENX34901.1 hypothetical protein F889_01541 [Acinetobacter colistiniresistens]